MKKTIALLLSLAALAACSNGKVKLMSKADFDRVIDGDTVSLYTLRGGDLTMQVTNFGGRVVSLWTPDRNGRYADVVLGNSTLDGYLAFNGDRFLGASVGPVANRIGDAAFCTEEGCYMLSDNDHGNTLHGGLKGIDMLVWKVSECTDSSITMSAFHPNGLDGFPGNTLISAIYTLTADNALRIDFEAVSDQDTPINLAHHPFFNLSGRADKDVLGYELTVNAYATTPIDSLMIPTGEISPVNGTVFDFREPGLIGACIDCDDEQLRFAKGYDHNWVISRQTEDSIEFDASVYDPESGRGVQVWSDQPGLQIYTGNFFKGDSKDKYGHTIGYRCAIALETQKFPDAVHHANFPDIVLKSGHVYRHTCLYKFYAE